MPGTIEFPPLTHSQKENAAVLCRDVTKDFGSGEGCVRALNGVDFEARSGEITMLVGPSGCGKTTLLSVIGGLLNKSSGHLMVLGADMQQLKGAASVQFRLKNIGFVFQQYNLLPSLTAAENAAVPLMAAGMRRKDAVTKATAILEHLGMHNRAHVFPNRLSGGQQQRVAIARALIHEPKLLVCDEPTAALDADTGRSVMKLLRQTAVRPDRAVIVVTHDSRVFGFGDRIAYMNDGRIIKTEAIETSPEASSHEILQRRLHS
jgi:putative ABC transport system ATP-binding protein